MREDIFTDAVKDIIGDAPVLDQFDISYEASFFNGSQDDYITGAILIKNTAPDGSYFLSAGSRGQFFSKIFSDEAPPLSSDWGSPDVKSNPSAAYRQVPWSERTSRTAYRFTHHVDDAERFYDSCLPNIGNCFSVNGASAWVPHTDPITQLSPHGNIPFTSGAVLMFFNSYAMDRSGQGFSKDPLVNNEWTWSYPYENKYFPEVRFLKINKSFGIQPTNLSADWGLAITDGDWALKVGDINFSKLFISPTGLIPILPGHIEGSTLKNLASFDTGVETTIYARNSFRKPFEFIDSIGKKDWCNTVPYLDTSKDEKHGISIIVPADVNLDIYADHSFSSPPPLPVLPNELLTGSMFPNDMIKFLFGFGDLNNMTHAFEIINTGSFKNYDIDFEVTTDPSSGSYSGDIQASALASYSDEYITIDWSGSPTVNSWAAYCREGHQDFFDGKQYNYYNGGNSPPSRWQEEETTGFMWVSSSSPSNSFILKSDTITTFEGGTMDPESMGTSTCCVDITSSFPWSIRYKRGVVAPIETYQVKSSLHVYFSGTPAKSSNELSDGPFQIIKTLDHVTGAKYYILNEFDSLNVATSVDQTSSNNPNIFSPGSWRLNFSYIRGKDASEGGSVELGAAIDDLEIFVYDNIVPDIKGPKLGGNNYPHFRKYKIDPRTSPVYSNANGYSEMNRKISSELYRGTLVGISPVIRGWKYGLFNGFPTNSKAIWRRNSYGQLRDMLEQRQYTKFIKSNSPTVENEPITLLSEKGEVGEKLKASKTVGAIGDSPVTVNFVEQVFTTDTRGIGYIYNKKLDISQSIVHDMNNEVTSSAPYKEGDNLTAVENVGLTNVSTIKIGTTYSLTTNAYRTLSYDFSIFANFSAETINSTSEETNIVTFSATNMASTADPSTTVISEFSAFTMTSTADAPAAVSVTVQFSADTTVSTADPPAVVLTYAEFSADTVTSTADPPAVVLTYAEFSADTLMSTS